MSTDTANQLHRALLRVAAANGNLLSFRDFSETVLFEPGCGYYTSQRNRVGTAAGTDFYTAPSAGGEMFGRLIAEAAQTMLGEDLSKYTLVEIGAEPGQSHFSSAAKKFADFITIKVGEKIQVPENAVVVANELLDACPFHRLVFKDGEWKEIGVFCSNSGDEWIETILPEISSAKLRSFIAQELPTNIDEDWHIDISLDAEELLEKILSGGWRGAMIFLDYGKTLADCLEAFPAGTARAYFRHRQTDNLTANPGEQDLTCHVFWDRLASHAKSCGFNNAKIFRQEAFLMKFALSEIGKIIDSGDQQHSQDAVHERNKLLELIHPSNMGHLFQVLAGTRQ